MVFTLDSEVHIFRVGSWILFLKRDGVKLWEETLWGEKGPRVRRPGGLIGCKSED
jgi:hypothetical protein